jgi:opacity protein-like surface antigen
MDEVTISRPTINREFTGNYESHSMAFVHVHGVDNLFPSGLEPMSKSRCMVVALICSLVAMPTIAQAQAADSTKEHAQDFVHDVLRALFGPNWNLFAHGGVTTSDRFLLQQVSTPIVGERALQSATGWDVGGGAGVDILLRTGFRASYTFTSSKLNFRTDNGNGSGALNIDDVGQLKSQTLALELIRYMLPTRAAINPYGTLGIQGTWWTLDDKSPLITGSGASTPFSVSPLFSFGVQFKASNRVSARLEATLFGGHNPFTGNKSFRSLTGQTIDEPPSVQRTAFRVAGVYHFGRSKMPTVPATVTHE